MGKSFVYNTGSSDDDKKDDELRFVFGVFIDGTLNNKTNTEMRRKYRKEDEKSIINKGSEKDKADLEKEAKDYTKLKKNDFKLALKGTTEREYQEYLIGIHRDKIDKQGTDNSYSNDDTNVTRMWRCCDSEKYAIYVEGMGTGDLQYDSQDGFAFGSGLTGIRNRVRTACQRVVEKIVEKKKDNKDAKITEITLDIFGFSRGAASARNFAYEVSKSEYDIKGIEIPYLESVYVKPQTYHDEFGIPTTIGGYYTTKQKIRKSNGDSDGLEIDKSLLVDGRMPRLGHLGYCLLQYKVLKPEELENIQIIVRFIGLYDTVSSYYEVGALGSYKSDGTLEDDGKFNKLRKEAWSTHFNDDEKELNLHLAPNSFQKMVHFTAKDEHRRNFSLTRISQIGDKAIEKNFPGVHCDIGGAYENGTEVIDEIGTSISDHDFKREIGWGVFSPIIPVIVPIGLKSLKQDLIEKCWYKENELEINIQSGWLPPSTSFQKLTGTRFVKKEYSYVPLHFMEEFCRKTSMVSFFIDETSIKYPIPEYLEDEAKKEKENNMKSLFNKSSVMKFPFVGYFEENLSQNSERYFLSKVKSYLHKYVFEDGNEWEFKSDEQIKKEKEDREERETLEAKRQRANEYLEKNKYRFELPAVDNLDSKYYEPEIRPQIEKKTELTEEELRTITLEEVEIESFNPQRILRKLRHEYIHWSSNRDWFGMEPNSDRKRRYFSKK